MSGIVAAADGQDPEKKAARQRRFRKRPSGSAPKKTFAHPGGKLSSNKEAAEHKFLSKKIRDGADLTEAQQEAVDAAGGPEAFLAAAPPAGGAPAAPAFQAYVGNLPRSTTSASGLAGLKEAAEGVASFVAIADRTTDECRGFGFATFDDQVALDAFVLALNEKPLLGSDALTVSAAKKVVAARAAKPPRRERGPRPAKAPAADGDAAGDKPKPAPRRRRNKPGPKKPKDGGDKPPADAPPAAAAPAEA